MGDRDRAPPLLHSLGGHRVPYFVLKLMSIQALLRLGEVGFQLTEDPRTYEELGRIKGRIPEDNNQHYDLKYRLHEWWSNCRPWFVDNPKLATYVAEMEAQTKQDLCRSCSGGSPCRGTAHSSLDDSKRLTERGFCIETFVGSLRYAEQVAKDSYARYVPGLALPSVPLVLAYAMSRDKTVNCAVTGCCTESRTTQRHVKLALEVESFDWTDYVASFAIVFHEYFVHAWSATRVQSESAPTCESFHEGWIQMVGMLVLKKHLEGLYFHGAPPPSVPELVQRNAPTYLARANSLDHQRRDVSMNSRATPWGIAYRSATVVQAWIARLRNGHGDADELFATFSLILNASSDFSDKERGALATGGRWLLDPDRTGKLSHTQRTGVLVALEKLVSLTKECASLADITSSVRCIADALLIVGQE